MTDDAPPDVPPSQRPGHPDLKALYPRACRNLSSTIEAWGFECRSGWWPVIQKAIAEVDAMLTDEEAARFHLEQIKEKWGELRIYWQLREAPNEPVPEGRHVMRATAVGHNLVASWIEPRRAAIEAIVKRAHEQAAATCEVCGRSGSLRLIGYVQTLCDEHEQDYLESRRV